MVADGRQHQAPGRLAGLAQGGPGEQALPSGLELAPTYARNVGASGIPAVARVGVLGTVAGHDQGTTARRGTGMPRGRGHGRIVPPWCDLPCHSRGTRGPVMPKT